MEESDMLRLGCIILSIWGGVYLIASAMSLVTSIMGTYAPMMKIVLTDSEIAAVDSKTLGVTRSLGIMHNSGATVFAVLVLLITWFSLSNGQQWSFWTLLSAGAFAHAMWILADSSIGHRTMVVNVILSVVFLAGIAVSGLGLFT
jgi:hypothetical protein